MHFCAGLFYTEPHSVALNCRIVGRGERERGGDGAKYANALSIVPPSSLLPAPTVISKVDCDDDDDADDDNTGQMFQCVLYCQASRQYSFEEKYRKF